MTPDERRLRNAKCQSRRRQHYGYYAPRPAEERDSQYQLPRDLVAYIDARIEVELNLLREN